MKRNYNIYLNKTKEFKTITISFVFQRKNNVLDELYRTLLRKILLLKTAKYDTQEKLSIASFQLYSPIVTLKTDVSKDYRSFNLTGQFLNEKYTEKGMNKKNIEFIMDYFWHPFLKDNMFDENDFALCKKKYIEELKSIKNYPDEYSLNSCWRELNLYEFKIPPTEEYLKMLEKITVKDLYNYYKSMFTDSLNIYITGDISEDIPAVIDNYIYGDFSLGSVIKASEYKVDEIKKVQEKADIPQSKLILAYKANGLSKFENEYVSLIFAMILGGGTTSFLHEEAREEHSLCYYIYANYYILFNIMLIESGINSQNKEKIVKIAQKAIDKIKNGDFTLEKLAETKKIYKNVLLEAQDSPLSITNNLIAMVTRGADKLSEKIAKVDEVTKDDVINFAKKIKLDTIYMLEGIR